MFIASLDLVGLHRHRINSIYHEDIMIPIFDKGNHIEVTCKLITVQVASDRHKLTCCVMICSLNQVCCVLFALFSKFLGDLVALGRRQSIGIIFVVFSLAAGLSLRVGQRAHRGTAWRLDILWLCFLHDWCWLMILILLLRGLHLLLPLLSLGVILIISKEIHILRLVHEVGLVSLYNRHIIDSLLIDRCLRLHTPVKKRLVSINLVGIVIGLTST